jgi:hypothetical protein
MHVGWKIAIGAGLVGGAALALTACGNQEKDAQSFVLDKFGKMDDDPQDNKWTAGEVEQGWTNSRWQEVNTYRVGDYVYGTKQRLEWPTTDSMRRVYDAAKGNDAVLSLKELADFAMTYDADKNGTLNHDERRSFEKAYQITTTRGQTRVTHEESFIDYRPRVDYPDPYYPPNNGGPTSPGDDGGWYEPPSNGGTSGGDDGGYIPPSSGGSGGTSGGDDGGGYVPPSSGGSGGGTSSGDSTDNGDPDRDMF